MEFNKRKPPAAGKGRPVGSVNKTTRELKEMILLALNVVGGELYLVRCAQDPKTAPAFLSLLGKILPMQVNASVAVYEKIERVIIEQGSLPAASVQMIEQVPAETLQ